VTHQIQFIKKATKILVLKDGKPLAFGVYHDLINSGLDFMSLLNEQKIDKQNDQQNEKIDTQQTSEQFLKERTLSELSDKSQVNN
jgi:ATP-binding cassette subfamily C (CFTR/MRP) protein 4